MINLKENQEKKVVVFSLLKDKLNMTAMVELGYCRDEISALFKKLQESQYGQHVPGKRGRNGVEKFIPNDLCPDSFQMTFDKRPMKHHEDKEEDTGPTNGVVLAKFLSMDRQTPERIPDNGKPGYIVNFSKCNNYILLDRLSDGGFLSIEDAVSSIYDEIKDRVTTYPSKIMTDVEQIASKLRGVGFISLQ